MVVFQDCEVLGLADRPEKLIITNVAVPPIPIRPSVIMDGSQRFPQHIFFSLVALTCYAFVVILMFKHSLPIAAMKMTSRRG